MPYEIDQSNKIEVGRKPTALALTNDDDYSIAIPANERRAAFAAVQNRYERKSVTIMFFTAAVYFLVRELPAGATVSIDCEYTGKERYIRGLLLQWLRDDRPDITADRITFGQVGRKSRAHKTALAIHRGEREADRTLRADDLVAQITGSKKAK